MQAQHYADTIQDFNKEYEEVKLVNKMIILVDKMLIMVNNMLLQVASKCESFAMTLLDKCTTKHEIQTLLQTKYLSFS